MSGKTLIEVKSIANWLRVNRLTAFFLIVVLLLAFTPLRLISFFGLLLWLSSLLSLRMGLLSKLAVSFSIFTCYLTCLGAFAWLSGLALSSGIVLALAWGILFAWWSMAKRPAVLPWQYKLLDRYDLAALLISIGAMIVLIWPLFGGLKFSTLASIVMTGGDNSAHLEMIKVNDLNKGYSIGFGNRVDMPPNNVSYPQGWHLSSTFTKWLVEPLADIDTSPLRILAFYFAFSVLWFGLLVFLAARLALRLLETISPRSAGLTVTAVSLVTSIGVLGWMYPLFEYGFQTHLAALSMLLMSMLLIIEAYKHKPDQRYGYYTGALLAVAGVSFLWSFLLPVALLIVSICILQTTIRQGALPSLAYLAGLVIISWCLLLQPLFQVAFSVMVSQSESLINLRGNVVQTAMHPMILVFFGLTAYLYYRFSSKALRAIYMAVAIALLFSLIVMFYQLSTIDELRYYYFKSTYTYILLASIVLAAFVGDIVQQALSSKHFMKLKLHKMAITLALIVIFINGVWVLRSSAVDDFIYNRLGGVSAGQADAISNIMAKDVNAGLSLIPIGSCNRGNDIRAAQLAHALIYSERTNDPSVYGYVELSYLDKNYLYSALHEYLKAFNHVTVVSSDLVISNELRTRLGSDSHKATFVELDTTMETEPITQCPDRVRELTATERATGVK